MTDTHPAVTPETPDSDDPTTAMIQRHMRTFFGLMAGNDQPEESGCLRYVTRLEHPFANLATIAPRTSAAEITEICRPLADDAFPSAVILKGGDTETQSAPLKDLGFFFAESMCLMSVTPQQLTPTTLPEGYRLVEVGPDDDDRWNDTFAAGYEIPRPLAAMFGPATFEKRHGKGQYFAAERDGELAAVSMFAHGEGGPGIYAVATLPQHRGRGLGAHLTAEPLRIAWRDGSESGVLQSSAMGEPVYRRIGFQSHGHMAVYVRIPEGDAE